VLRNSGARHTSGIERPRSATAATLLPNSIWSCRLICRGAMGADRSTALRRPTHRPQIWNQELEKTRHVIAANYRGSAQALSDVWLPLFLS